MGNAEKKRMDSRFRLPERQKNALVFGIFGFLIFAYFTLAPAPLGDDIWFMGQTGGIGADITIESSGSVQALCGCLSGVAPGGKVICVGNPKGDFNLPKDVYWQILRKQLVMYGTWNSSFDSSDKNDWKIAIDAMASGKIQNDKLITHKFSLEDMDKGLDIMRNATEFYSKIIVTP